MRKYLLQVLIGLIISFTVQAQQKDIKFKKSNFKNDPKGLKFALQKLGDGNQFIQNGGYGLALAFYLSADSINPYNADLNAKIGVCYLNLVDKAKCLQYFRMAHALKKKISKRIDFFLGRGYQLNYQWDSAITEYNIALKSGSKKDHDEINKCIEECNNGAELMKFPVKVTLTNLASINSSYSDYRPLVTSDGTEMIFTSRRHSNLSTELNPETGEYNDDIFIAHSKNGTWDSAENLDPPVNTIDNDESAFLTPDGKMLYLIRDIRGGDFSVTKYSDSRGWSLPLALNDSVNSMYAESSMCISPDGKTLYFVSDKPGGIGKKDIYQCALVGDSAWGTPVNLGPTINTPYDEDGVFMNPDGKTLYFSSKGHNTIGGYDIFMTTKDGDTWSDPKNLGYPINTPDDDVYFSTSEDGYYGYYGRTTNDNKLDIFRITMTAFMPRDWVYSGAVTDSITHSNVKVKFDLINKATGLQIPTGGADSVMGNYLVKLHSGHQYTIRMSAKGYKDFTQDIIIPDTAYYQPITKNILMVKGGESGGPGSHMNDSCLQPIATIMERFKGMVKDTSVVKNALAHMDATFCLKELRFSVQLAAIQEGKKFNYKKYAKKIEIEEGTDGKVRLTTGSFYKYEEARKEMEAIKRKGIKDVWIVGIYNGKRYILKELMHPAQ
jgi:hypothetical protein